MGAYNDGLVPNNGEQVPNNDGLVPNDLWQMPNNDFWQMPNNDELVPNSDDRVPDDKNQCIIMMNLYLIITKQV